MSGKDAVVGQLLNEAGGHRWQRVPPTEKRGRTQTSTVTVAVLHVPERKDYKLSDRDIEEFVTTGSGPGGQHRNKTQSCVTVRHKPTGIECRADMRSQHVSRDIARSTLEARVAAHYARRDQVDRNQDRRRQMGSGQRADKIRTYREQDDQVTDHRSGNKLRLKKVMSGYLPE